MMKQKSDYTSRFSLIEILRQTNAVCLASPVQYLQCLEFTPKLLSIWFKSTI